MKIQNLPRGLRNNNPANIRKNYANNWKGMSELQSDISFVQFTSLEYGLRALMKLLINYQKNYLLYSVHDIISRYAPCNENDTSSYVQFVLNFLRQNCPRYWINSQGAWFYENKCQLFLLVRAICKMESNYDPSEALLEKSYSML